MGGVDGRCWRVLMGKALFVADRRGNGPDSLRLHFLCFPAPIGKAPFAAIQMKQATLPQQPSIERRVFCVSEKQMRSSTRSDRQDRLLRRAMPDRIAKVGCAPLGSCYHQLCAKPFLGFSYVGAMSDIGNTSLPTISTCNIQLAKCNATSNRQWQQAMTRGVGNSH